MSVPLNEKRLIERREACNFTKIEAAKKMGLTQSGYVRYELGERKPTLQIVEAMASCLGTSVGYLLDQTDDSTPDRIIISKDKDPLLFDLVNNYINSDESQRERLLSYINKLASK